MSVYAGAFSAAEKEDSSPVTEADLRADGAIRAALERVCPGLPVVSEESRPQRMPDGASPFFLVDPLDGTKEFIARTGDFTVNIALIRHGFAVAGAVFAPARGLMYHAAAGQGALRSRDGVSHRIHVRPYTARKPVRIVGSRSHGGARLAAWVEALQVPMQFSAAGSSLKFCRVAEGAAHLYPRLGRTYHWDTAAAQCVLEEAGGGMVTDLRGSRLRYEPRDGWFNTEFIASCGARSLALCGALKE
jgi:3'(2'), 5'-bisphosphate nucleotidase